MGLQEFDAAAASLLGIPASPHSVPALRRGLEKTAWCRQRAAPASRIEWRATRMSAKACTRLPAPGCSSQVQCSGPVPTAAHQLDRWRLVSPAVGESFQRVGRILHAWGNDNQVAGCATLERQHSTASSIRHSDGFRTAFIPPPPGQPIIQAWMREPNSPGTHR